MNSITNAWRLESLIQIGGEVGSQAWIPTQHCRTSRLEQKANFKTHMNVHHAAFYFFLPHLPFIPIFNSSSNPIGSTHKMTLESLSPIFTANAWTLSQPWTKAATSFPSQSLPIPSMQPPTRSTILCPDPTHLFNGPAMLAKYRTFTIQLSNCGGETTISQCDNSLSHRLDLVQNRCCFNVYSAINPHHAPASYFVLFLEQIVVWSSM